MNNTLRAYYNTHKNLPNPIYSTSAQHKKAALTLPFLDDFSQNNIYPNGVLWEDINVYINSNFPDNPISYGVATFDGLDSTGTPYNFALPNSYGPADTLTSRAIDLTTIIDSVFLSFYYQPQGNGNKPEAKDSLRLEFFRQSDSTWIRMWGVQGSPNHPFKKVMIPVGTSFHNNEFQFRFMNWATLSGNVDHWHVDYIYLNENRNYTDTALNDVSFITNHHNMLKELTGIPWEHYMTDSIGLMDTAMTVIYKNNHSSQYTVFYQYDIITNNGSGSTIETYPSPIESKTVNAYSSLIEPQAVYKTSPFVNDFSFPSDFSTQTKVFQIRNYLSVSPNDFHTKNDTVFSYQTFGSYYAYDDGSAENGYGVQGIGSKLAHEFNIKKDDTLTAFQIYFNPIQNNLSGQTFRLKVWSSLNPEVEVYSQAATLFTNPVYSNTNEFLIYNLDVPVILNAGTYYFGWEKISGEFLNIGWDVNTNNNSKVYFNAVGVWQNASFSGTLMLRPVFGNIVDPVVSVKDNKTLLDDFKVYPNPSSNVLYFKSNNNKNYDIQLIDIYGKIIIETTSTISNKFDVSNLANGIYIIRFTNNNSYNSILKKIIISK